MTLIEPPEVNRHVYKNPVCESITRDGKYCRRLSVTAVSTDAGARARCPEHSPSDAPRLCVTCHQANDSGNPYRCEPCGAKR